MQHIKMKKQDAVDYYGSKTKLADAVGVTRQAVTQWGEYLPERVAWPIYYLLKGKVPADLWIKPG